MKYEDAEFLVKSATLLITSITFGIWQDSIAAGIVFFMLGIRYA